MLVAKRHIFLKSIQTAKNMYNKDFSNMHIGMLKVVWPGHVHLLIVLWGKVHYN